MEHTKKQNNIISERMINGKLYVNIYSDALPDSEWIPIAPNLEDVFFYYTQLEAEDAKFGF